MLCVVLLNHLMEGTSEIHGDSEGEPVLPAMGVTLGPDQLAEPILNKGGHMGMNRQTCAGNQTDVRVQIPELLGPKAIFIGVVDLPSDAGPQVRLQDRKSVV